MEMLCSHVIWDGWFMSLTMSLFRDLLSAATNRYRLGEHTNMQRHGMISHAVLSK